MNTDKNIVNNTSHNNTDSIKERLKLFLIEKRLKVSEFAEKAGVTKSLLYRGDDTKASVLIKICKAFPDLNIRWLLGLDEKELMFNEDDRKLIEKLRKTIELAEIEKLKLQGQVEILKELFDNERKEEPKNNPLNRKNDV